DSTIRSTSLSLQLTSFFFHTPPPSQIYTLSLHDALPICVQSLGLQAHEHRYLQLMRRAEHAIRKIIRDQPLVVIGKHQRVEPLEGRNNEPQKLFLRFLAYRF